MSNASYFYAYVLQPARLFCHSDLVRLAFHKSLRCRNLYGGCALIIIAFGIAIRDRKHCPRLELSAKCDGFATMGYKAGVLCQDTGIPIYGYLHRVRQLDCQKYAGEERWVIY